LFFLPNVRLYVVATVVYELLEIKKWKFLKRVNELVIEMNSKNEKCK